MMHNYYCNLLYIIFIIIIIETIVEIITIFCTMTDAVRVDHLTIARHPLSRLYIVCYV